MRKLSEMRLGKRVLGLQSETSSGHPQRATGNREVILPISPRREGGTLPSLGQVSSEVMVWAGIEISGA